MEYTGECSILHGATFTLLALMLDYFPLVMTPRLRAAAELHVFFAKFKFQNLTSCMGVCMSSTCSTYVQCTCRWMQTFELSRCRQSILGTDNTRDNSIYNCSIFLLWLPSNVLISFLVLSLIPQETVVGRELPVFTAAHIKEGLTT